MFVKIIEKIYEIALKTFFVLFYIAIILLSIKLVVMLY
jgi:hypothetical protein